MQQKNTLGFTLLDLLIAIAVLCLLVSIAIPGMGTTIAKSKSKSLTSNIRSAIALARTKAITTERTVSVCGMNTTECIDEQFSKIVVFVDINDNGELNESDELLLFTKLNYDGEISLGASYGRDYIRFKKDGSAQQAGSFTYCNPHQPTHATRVTISMPGRLYMAKDLDNDGIIENADGSPISC